MTGDRKRYELTGPAFVAREDRITFQARFCKDGDVGFEVVGEPTVIYDGKVLEVSVPILLERRGVCELCPGCVAGDHSGMECSN